MKTKLLLGLLLLNNVLFGAQGGAAVAAPINQRLSLQDIAALRTLQIMKETHPKTYNNSVHFEKKLNENEAIPKIVKDFLIAKYKEAPLEASRLWIAHHLTGASPLQLLRDHKPELAHLLDQGLPWRLSFQDIIDAGGKNILISKINNHHGPICGHFNKLCLTSLEGFKTLPGTDQIENLYFQNNQLTIIDKDAFNNLPGLRNLYFTNNQLKTIDKDTFKNLAKLRILIFNNNQLTGIHKNTFYYLTELKELSLADNKFTTIDKDIFKRLLKLEYFSLLQGNQISPELLSSIKTLLPQYCHSDL
jgi:hypothetical protein